MESAFGVDHGEVSKALNPMKAFKGAQKVKPPSAPAFKAPWEQSSFKPANKFQGASGPLKSQPQQSPVGIAPQGKLGSASPQANVARNKAAHAQAGQTAQHNQRFPARRTGFG